MNVILMSHTADADWLCTVAGRSCYSREPMHDIEQSLDCSEWLRDKIARGHESILEHASFTFSIEGVSRALMAQLTRHRIASFSIQSQRYVRMGQLDVVIPPSVKEVIDDNDGTGIMRRAWEDACSAIEKAYNIMIRTGIPAEDARYILPNAVKTNIVLTMNARSLRHFFELRSLCQQAQWEIRELAGKMLSLCLKAAPGLFQDAGPNARIARSTVGNHIGIIWANATRPSKTVNPPIRGNIGSQSEGA
jgi:thymidylate synthase (FAD)